MCQKILFQNLYMINRAEVRKSQAKFAEMLPDVVLPVYIHIVNK